MIEKIRYVFSESRSGENVPSIVLPSGNTLSLHSTVDPKREAQRLICSIADDIGFLVFLGLGGGFAPQAALEITDAYIVVIDFDKESAASLLGSGDFSKLLNSNRFSLLLDPSGEEINKTITENYLPALYGGITTIPLRARTEQSRTEFENAVSVIQEAVESVKNDYSVQSHFGIRWFSNIIRNVRNINGNSNAFFNEKKQIQNAAIAAAGPSLDRQLTSLKDAKAKGHFIISCDTALPVLLHNALVPDAVVSIDCQHISYYHFIGCDLKNIPLILDIASPPSFYTLSQSPVFFISGHPLAKYINSVWRNFIQLDTSGGNVTHACLSLVENSGARNITFYGADFAYINSQTYAKGAYIYPYFEQRQNRLSPAEKHASALLYRSPFLSPDNTRQNHHAENNQYYETSSLRFYRKKLEEKIQSIDAEITFAKGYGAPVKERSSGGARSADGTTGEASSGTKNHLYNLRRNSADGKINGAEFLEQYRDDIAALPEGEGNYLKKLNIKEKQIFTTLLPFAAAVKKRNHELKQKDLIEEVKKQCIEKINQVLN